MNWQEEWQDRHSWLSRLSLRLISYIDCKNEISQKALEKHT